MNSFCFFSFLHARFSWCSLFVCLLFLTACGGKSGMTPKPQYSSTVQNGIIKDLQKLPQDLQYYAKKLPTSPLLATKVQKQESEKFTRIFFGAWQQKKAGYSKQTFLNTFGSARGYQGTQPWTEAQWQSLIDNGATESYPNVQRPAIVLEQTSLRELPTLAPRYGKPTAQAKLNPFDNFQYSTLAAGLPLYVSHKSRDGKWYFVENSIAGGWVQARHVGFVDAAFIRKYSQRPLLALIRDKVSLDEYGHAHIGAVFPLIHTGSQSHKVYFPKRGRRGMASITTLYFSALDAVPMPMPITAQNIAKVGDVMMGQLYGWGGHNEWRDCSATLRDMFTPFGIYLPRNSRGQYSSAYEFPLAQTLGNDGKKSEIRAYAKPFLSMIWMPGHIGLYLGTEQGEPVMFHNVWGIRVDEQGRGDDRFIIGRAVVTSLEPGAELPNLYNNQTILQRIGGFSTLPGPL